jgi:hypothetical protein
MPTLNAGITPPGQGDGNTIWKGGEGAAEGVGGVTLATSLATLFLMRPVFLKPK